MQKPHFRVVPIPACETGYDRPPWILISLLYALARLLVGLALTASRDNASRDVELLALRHIFAASSCGVSHCNAGLTRQSPL